MSFIRYIRRALVGLSLVLLLFTTTACNGAVQATQPNASPTAAYSQLERGNTAAGQNYGGWVVQASQGLIKDAYVRDNDKLGVVISSQVRPTEVRPLAKSLVQGFQKNFPNHDLTVLVYAPDKQLILTAKYNNASRNIEYQ
jgi:hypothetical protein